jgi:hypothetical protein
MHGSRRPADQDLAAGTAMPRRPRTYMVRDYFVCYRKPWLNSLFAPFMRRHQPLSSLVSELRRSPKASAAESNT